MKIPRLTPRLQKIFDAACICGCAADIGTDHAYIPVCLTLSGRCKKAIACDIKRGPLERAEKTISLYGAAERVQTRLGGGLTPLSPGEADTIIIAGMGGLLIAQILAGGEMTAKAAQRLILQPMTAAPELREYLISNGYKIEKEYLAREDSKIYNIISAASGKSEPYTAAELYMGRGLSEEADFTEYYKSRHIKLSRRIAGLAASKNPENYKKLRELEILKEMIENENF